MTLFTREQFASEHDEAGIFLDGLGAALITWAAMNYGKKHTVAEAAAAFNTTPAVIREAIDGQMWISWHGHDDDPSKQILELEGA